MHQHSTTRVRFRSSDDTLVANLHRPVGRARDRDAGRALIVTGSWTTSKEQQADFYARRLADAGYTALTFDFRGFGQSTGSPRDWECPSRKAEDIVAAVAFLGQLPGVDRDRIGGVAVCASAGYLAQAATLGAGPRSVAMVAPWLHTPELVAPYYGGPDGVSERIAASREAAAKFSETGQVDYIPAVSTRDPSAAMYGPYDYYLDPARGSIPEWGGRLAVMSWEPWLTFDAVSFAPRVTAPTLLVHSRDGAVPEGAEAFNQALNGSGRIRWTSGGQLDFYDQPAQVEFAMAAICDHFKETL